MIKYRVQKCDYYDGWKVVRIRGLEHSTVKFSKTHARALGAALEMAGLAKTPEPTC